MLKGGYVAIVKPPNAGHKIVALVGGAGVWWHLWELEMCLSR